MGHTRGRAVNLGQSGTIAKQAVIGQLAERKTVNRIGGVGPQSAVMAGLVLKGDPVAGEGEVLAGKTA